LLYFYKRINLFGDQSHHPLTKTLIKNKTKLCIYLPKNILHLEDSNLKLRKRHTSKFQTSLKKKSQASPPSLDLRLTLFICIYGWGSLYTYSIFSFGTKAKGKGYRQALISHTNSKLIWIVIQWHSIFPFNCDARVKRGTIISFERAKKYASR